MIKTELEDMKPYDWDWGKFAHFNVEDLGSKSVTGHVLEIDEEYGEVEEPHLEDLDLWR